MMKRNRDNQRERVYSAEKSLASWEPIRDWMNWERHESQSRMVARWHKKYHPGEPLSPNLADIVSRPEPEQRPMTLAQARTYVRRKVNSDWFRQEFGRVGRIDVVNRKSSAGACCHPHITGATLQLPPWSRWPIVILHELAHATTPAQHAWHGPEFALDFIKLVSHYIGTKEAKELKAAFRKHRVDYRRQSNGTH